MNESNRRVIVAACSHCAACHGTAPHERAPAPAQCSSSTHMRCHRRRHACTPPCSRCCMHVSEQLGRFTARLLGNDEQQSWRMRSKGSGCHLPSAAAHGGGWLAAFPTTPQHTQCHSIAVSRLGSTETGSSLHIREELHEECARGLDAASHTLQGRRDEDGGVSMRRADAS